MYNYIVSFEDSKSNKVEDMLVLSVISNITEFKKWLKNDLKSKGYGSIYNLKIDKE